MEAGNEENGARAMSDATLTCNAISKLIGSSHRCNRQNFLQRTSRKNLYTYSAKRPEHVEFCLSLLQMKKGEQTHNRRSSGRYVVQEIINAFGTTTFEVCSDLKKNVDLKIQPRHQVKKK